MGGEPGFLAKLFLKEPHGGGAKTPTQVASPLPLQSMPQSLQIPTSLTAPIVSHSATQLSGGEARTDDQAALMESLNRGVKPGFTEFLGSYMDLVDEGIDRAKAITLTIKALARQGISLPEVQLAFFERIEILNNEKKEFTTVIDEDVTMRLQQTNSKLETDRQARDAKKAQIELLQGEVSGLNQSISENEQALSQFASKKEKRITDFNVTFQQVYDNIGSIKELLDKQGGV